MATNTDLIRELTGKVNVLTNEVENLKYETRQMQADRTESIRLHSEHQKEIALLRQSNEELRKRQDELDRRFWWIVTAVLLTCLTAIGGLVLAVIKR